MIKKTLLIVYALIAQPLFAKITLNADFFAKKADKLIEKVETIHGKNIDLIKSFPSPRTQEQDAKIEKEVYHKVLQLNRDPGFLKAFFFTGLAEKQQRCPFLWYYEIVKANKRQVKKMKKSGEAKIKHFSKSASLKKTTPADAQKYKKLITEVECITKKLKKLETNLIELNHFIKCSKTYTKELQSRPSYVAQPVYVVNPTYSIY